MESNPFSSQKRFSDPYLIIIPLVIAIITFAVYWQVNTHDFLKFDDNTYVKYNQHVNQRINIDNLIWAFTPSQTDKQTYWHPLTWISHMLDVQIFGLHPGAHHLMNLFIHIINSALLFMALFLLTREKWKSAFVAGIFALHPINVETVAWIAERKNLLSTTFWMLSLLVYHWYTRRPGALRFGFLMTAVLFGLMAKPMLVTLPFVLLLIDFWPLGRINLGQPLIKSIPAAIPVYKPVSIYKLIMEKIPLLALSIGVILISIFSLQTNNQIIDPSVVPMHLRIENAIVSYVVYLWKIIWPTHLAVLYPFPENIPLWQPVCAAFFLIAVSAYILFNFRKSPWLLTGWLWYLGTLFPVIGLVQGGLWPAWADRWAYVPSIGFFIIIAWGVPALIPHHRLKGPAFLLMAAAVLSLLSITTWKQTGYWKNTQTLFEHTLAITQQNEFAHNLLGYEMEIQGELNRALNHYKLAIQINPDDAKTHFNIGNILSKKGHVSEAVPYFYQAIELDHDFTPAYINLANALYGQGNYEKAIELYQIALAQNPDGAEVHLNFANALHQNGQTNQAISHYLKAIELNANLPEAYNNLGVAYINRNDINLAINNFKEALSLKPDYLSAQQNLKKALQMR